MHPSLLSWQQRTGISAYQINEWKTWWVYMWCEYEVLQAWGGDVRIIQALEGPSKWNNL